MILVYYVLFIAYYYYYYPYYQYFYHYYKTRLEIRLQRTPQLGAYSDPIFSSKTN